MNTTDISTVLQEEAKPKMIRVQDKLWDMVVVESRISGRRPSAQLSYILAVHYGLAPR